jgi:hypothetical protein
MRNVLSSADQVTRVMFTCIKCAFTRDNQSYIQLKTSKMTKMSEKVTRAREITKWA